MTTPYKFTITSGMDGYMPNYSSGPYVASTRRELASIIRDELAMLDYPANRFADFNVRRAWRFIQSAGSGSSCHLSCEEHGSECLSLHGLTDAEYSEAEEAEDF